MKRVLAIVSIGLLSFAPATRWLREKPSATS